MPYLPIEHHGIVGNMHTAALVGVDGSIDWMCVPRFDSPSLFAALLDDEKGGRFRIAPSVEADLTHKQFYWPDTNVLVTRAFSAEGAGQVVDFMPAGVPVDDPRRHWLIRRVQTLRGRLHFRLDCHPAFDYGRAIHEVEVSAAGARFHAPELSLELTSTVPLAPDRNGVVAEFELGADETAVFVLRPCMGRGGCRDCVPENQALVLFKETVDFWRRWLSQCTYRGRWRETVHRSALLLKLLTFEPTGAIVAAPTCSLPERIGGGRNWDYRYTWIRDSAFTLYALLRIGFTEEAAAFMRWLEARCHELEPDGSLRIMYGIDGRHELPETVLEHFEGYRGSAPVRIGNGAYGQLQLDIYGELLDSVYLFNKYGTPISYDLWRYLRRLVDWVCENWQLEDEGIWEVRGGKRHFVYSKLMCWVALDRGVRLADRRSFPADRARWLRVRDEIYEDIMKRGWSEQRRAFVQAYGSEALDAAQLIMPLVFFTSPSDPRMLQTIDAICERPEKGGLLSNSLVFRYDTDHTSDGLVGGEGTFNICTFWLVEALTRAGRHDRVHLDRARLIFEQMLGYANHLGLYAEQTGFHGEALGNFPQAFTHLSLISAAYNLDRTLGASE